MHFNALALILMLTHFGLLVLVWQKPDLPQLLLDNTAGSSETTCLLVFSKSMFGGKSQRKPHAELNNSDQKNLKSGIFLIVKGNSFRGYFQLDKNCFLVPSQNRIWNLFCWYSIMLQNNKVNCYKVLCILCSLWNIFQGHYSLKATLSPMWHQQTTELCVKNAGLSLPRP